MVYRRINHAGCWKNTRRICSYVVSQAIYWFETIYCKCLHKRTNQRSNHCMRRGVTGSTTYLGYWPMQVLVSIGSRAHVWLTCSKQGQVVRKGVSPNPRLKISWIIFPYTNVFHCFFLVFWETRWPNCVQKTLLESRKPQIKIHAHPGLA